MPPIGPLLKNDGPACRVCSCTEHNACVLQGDASAATAKGARIPATRMPRLLTCSWVITEGATEPLCSACSGTELDAIEVLNRLQRFLKQHGEEGVAFAGVMVSEALSRWKKRQRQNKG